MRLPTDAVARGSEAVMPTPLSTHLRGPAQGICRRGGSALPDAHSMRASRSADNVGVSGRATPRIAAQHVAGRSRQAGRHAQTANFLSGGPLGGGATGRRRLGCRSAWASALILRGYPLGRRVL